MRSYYFVLPLAGAVSSMMLASAFAADEKVLADQSANAPAPPPVASPAPPSCACPSASDKPQRPKFAGFPSSLDESDEIAALSALHEGLATTADGAKYVWHRGNGRLSGIVNPVNSFRNGDGAICRHIVVLLTTGLVTKKTEGTACRGQGGRWELAG